MESGQVVDKNLTATECFNFLYSVYLIVNGIPREPDKSPSPPPKKMKKNTWNTNLLGEMQRRSLRVVPRTFSLFCGCCFIFRVLETEPPPSKKKDGNMKQKTAVWRSIESWTVKSSMPNAQLPLGASCCGRLTHLVDDVAVLETQNKHRKSYFPFTPRQKRNEPNETKNNGTGNDRRFRCRVATFAVFVVAVENKMATGNLTVILCLFPFRWLSKSSIRPN